MNVRDAAIEIDQLELDLLLEGLHRAYGVDVRGAPRHLVEAAVNDMLEESGARNVSALLERVLHDRDYGERAAGALRFCGLDLFADAAFYAALRERVVPWLRTYPFSTIWVVQCGAGSEVYSIAILLEEEGLYERTRIYATDGDQATLSRAHTGLMSPAGMRFSERNYRACGGAHSLLGRFEQHEGRFAPTTALKRNIVWAEYSLCSGQTFNEFNLIVCRDVLGTLPATAQRHACWLLTQSLCRSGLLALGHAEKPDEMSRASWFRRWIYDGGFYQRVR